jgi:hypothetical protein
MSKKVVNLTKSNLKDIVKKIVSEQIASPQTPIIPKSKQPINENKKIIRLTESDLKKYVEKEINEQLKKPNQIWTKVSEYLKSAVINGFKFSNFIENLAYQGVDMKNDRGELLQIEPNGKWTIYNTDGRGINQGIWKWDGTKIIISK